MRLSVDAKGCNLVLRWRYKNHEFRVFLHPKASNNTRLAFCSYNGKEKEVDIFIGSNLDHRRIPRILLHELIHGILFAEGLGGGSERVVAAIEEGLWSHMALGKKMMLEPVFGSKDLWYNAKAGVGPLSDKTPKKKGTTMKGGKKGGKKSGKSKSGVCFEQGTGGFKKHTKRKNAGSVKGIPGPSPDGRF